MTKSTSIIQSFAFVLFVIGLISACDPNAKTIRYEAEPAAEAAVALVEHGLVGLDFNRAASYMAPELGVNDEATSRLVFAGLGMYGFPHEVSLSHFAFDYENNLVLIVGTSRGLHMNSTIIVAMERRSGAEYKAKDVRVRRASIDDMEGLRKLPVVQQLSRSSVLPGNSELQQYLNREKVLFPPKEGQYATYAGESYAPASAVYQRLYQGEWAVEVEYVSAFSPTDSSPLVEEAERFFDDIFRDLMEIAGVKKCILAARKPGSDDVYRVLFEKLDDESWARANP